MAEHNWGHDPEFVEEPAAIHRKLLWLALFAGTGAASFAVNHWMNGQTGFRWAPCVIAAVCGTVALGVFAHSERLPISAGLAPGAVAGMGAYLASVGYVSWRDSVRIVELAIPAIAGALPGVVLFVVSVRVYYWLTDS